MQCPKCSFDGNLDDDIFCRKCSFEINSNFCTNKLCDINAGRKVSFDLDTFFCPVCNSKTEFYHLGLIKPK